MDEERLIKFTSEICSTKDTLWNMIQVLSLDPIETQWLCQCTKSSVYDGMDFYNALMQFSHDYLKSKGIEVQIQEACFDLESCFQNKDYVAASVSYVSNMFGSDDKSKTRGSR